MFLCCCSCTGTLNQHLSLFTLVKSMHGAADKFGSHNVIMNPVKSEPNNDPVNVAPRLIFKSRFFCAISYASCIILTGVMPCGKV